jgi:hypothetical protein
MPNDEREKKKVENPQLVQVNQGRSANTIKNQIIKK